MYTGKDKPYFDYKIMTLISIGRNDTQKMATGCLNEKAVSIDLRQLSAGKLLLSQ